MLVSFSLSRPVLSFATDWTMRSQQQQGILHAGGDRILFVDADGASHFPDLALLQAELDRVETTPRSADGQGGHGLVVGSRAHLVRTEAVVKVCLHCGPHTSKSEN